MHGLTFAAEETPHGQVGQQFSNRAIRVAAAKNRLKLNCHRVTDLSIPFSLGGSRSRLRKGSRLSLYHDRVSVIEKYEGTVVDLENTMQIASETEREKKKKKGKKKDGEQTFEME